MDMTEFELQKAYKHCYSMLYNKSRYTPGKIVLRDSLGTLGIACVTELFVRYLIHECEIESIKNRQDLLTLINKLKRECDIKNDDYISSVFNNLPDEYNKIKIRDLIDACLNNLGTFNNKLLTSSFLLAQGV